MVCALTWWTELVDQMVRYSGEWNAGSVKTELAFYKATIRKGLT